MNLKCSSVFFISCICVFATAQISPPRMVRMPDIHENKICFVAEGDIWIGDLNTHQAYRATSHENEESSPKFSPDGSRLAFTASYDGGNDVYVMPVSGGMPKRITYDPTGAEMVDWTPDGKSILFRSSRLGPGFYTRLFLVNANGGLPKPLPMEKASRGSFSPDGKKLAYTKIPRENDSWKRYKGGQAQGIWIANLSENSFRRINKEIGYEEFPIWVGTNIYYVSEKDGSANLWQYETLANKSKRITSHEEYDVRFPSSDGNRVIYQWGQDLFIFDPTTQKEFKIAMSITSDKIHARPYVTKGQIGEFDLSPNGKAIVSEFRGQLYRLPVGEGVIQNLFAESGVRAKQPIWSPDGKSVAFISDSGGEENIWLLSLNSEFDLRRLTNQSKLFISNLMWSPDSSKIMFKDNSETLSWVDVNTGRVSKIANGYYQGIFGMGFSPDSKWIAYASGRNNFSTCVWIYNISSGKSEKVTSDVLRVDSAAWDPDGKYFYYIAATAISPEWDGFDFQLNISKTMKIYALPLTSKVGTPMPIGEDEGTVTKDENDKTVAIDFGDIKERVVELPLDGSDYRNIGAISGGVIYLNEGELLKFSFEDKEESSLAKGVSGYVLTPDSKKIAIRTSRGVQVGQAGSPIGPGAISVDTADWIATINPEMEWKQMLNEAWRIQRDTFYDPMHHGMDWDAIGKRYEKLLPAVGTRQDLSRVIAEMIAEMNVSHQFVGGGTITRRPPQQPLMGHLGALLEWNSDAGLYQFTKIYKGDDYDLEARSPLLTPGNNVKVGDFLIAVNGRKLKLSEDPNASLVGLGGKIVSLEIASNSSPKTTRKILIRAMGSDGGSRYLDWVTSNREYVKKNGGDNLAYIHIPDMGESGMKEFAKEFYANLDKDGFVIDVRDNSGGIISGMILERFRRIIFEYDQARYTAPMPYHRTGFLSKLVLICNEGTSSDGEYFSTGWRQMNLGPSVGMRTWGGYAAVGGFQLLDGGFVSCPQQGSFSPDGKWLPDGEGFTPDFLVTDDPNAFVNGRDLQLDKAIELLKEQIKKDPPKWPKRQVPPSKDKAFQPNKSGGKM